MYPTCVVVSKVLLHRMLLNPQVLYKFFQNPSCFVPTIFSTHFCCSSSIYLSRTEWALVSCDRRTHMKIRHDDLNLF